MSLDFLRLQVSSGLVVAARHWRRICHTALTGYGISEACAAPLLMIVRLGDGVHQVAVAQAAGLESPSLVRLLDQLCKAGLVCRSEDPLDRRAKALSLTAEAVPWPKPSKPNWCACAAMCSAVSIRPTWKLPCACFMPLRLPAWAVQAGWHERLLQLRPSGP